MQAVQLKLDQSPVLAKGQPFLKWAGGKTQLLQELVSKVPKSFNIYFEPFLGSGALYFALSPQQAVISDINDDLINAFKIVRDHPEELISQLSTFENSKENFYEIRAQSVNDLSTIERAARLIYLNRTCFNGLYRVNKSGQFNVPYAYYKNPDLIQGPKIMADSDLLQGADILHASFEDVLKEARKHDFIYLDPPYNPLGGYSDFKRYNKEQFHKEDHEKLAQLYNELSDRGCYVMLSNSDTPFTRELYKDWRIETVFAKRMINCDATKRGEVTEIIVTNYDY